MKQISQLSVAVILVVLSLMYCAKIPTRTGSSSVITQPVDHIVSSIQTGDYVSEISYNADTTINSIRNKHPGGSEAPEKMFYYHDKKLIKVAEKTGYAAYAYSDNHVNEIIWFDKKDSAFLKYAYSYQGNDISEQIVYVKLANAGLRPFSKTAYAYGQPGNATKAAYFIYGNNVWEKTSEELITAYDSHKNYNSLFDNDPYIPLPGHSKNNPLKKEFRDASGAVTYAVNYSYTYDSQRKPATRESVSAIPGEPEVTITSTFAYYF